MCSFREFLIFLGEQGGERRLLLEALKLLMGLGSTKYLLLLLKLFSRSSDPVPLSLRL